ncbi:HIT family protein [Paraburkholderia sediminicola]
MRDAFPVSPGHTLIVSKQHVGSVFDLTAVAAGEILETFSG